MAKFPHWRRQLLEALGAPATRSNLRALRAWQQAEGGSASFNPLNTTQGFRGASDYNSVGVKNYPGAQAGLRATIQTLLNGRYGSVVQDLRAGAPARRTLKDVGRSPWGTSSGLLLNVLGQGGGGGGGGGGAPTAMPAPSGGGGTDRNALAMALLARIGENDPEEKPSIMDLVQANQADQPAPNAPGGGGVPSAAGGPGGGAAAMRAAIAKARQMGLNVGENPAAGGGLPTSGHVDNSWHYRTFGKHPNVGRGLDVSGDPQAMRRFALWLARNRAQEKELYYSPLGGRFVMKGHDDHVHVAY